MQELPVFRFSACPVPARDTIPGNSSRQLGGLEGLGRPKQLEISEDLGRQFKLEQQEKLERPEGLGRRDGFGK